MIDKRIFATGMGILTGAYGRQSLDAPTSLAYYDALSPHLSTEQFEQAVRAVIAAERFWPSPAVILEAAGVRPNSRAALQTEGARLFAKLKRWMDQVGGPTRVTAEECAELAPATWKAISAVGGLAGIHDVTPERVAKMERDFGAYYAEAVEGERAPELVHGSEARQIGEHHAPLPALLKRAS